MVRLGSPGAKAFCTSDMRSGRRCDDRGAKPPRDSIVCARASILKWNTTKCYEMKSKKK